MEMMLLGGEICAKYGIENVYNNIYIFYNRKLLCLIDQ